MANTSRFSFNGGILDERGRFRSDLEWYKASAKELDNVLIEPYGSARKRRGFVALDEVTPTYTNDDLFILPYDLQSDTDGYYFVMNAESAGDEYSSKLQMVVGSVLTGLTVAIIDTSIDVGDYQQWTSPRFIQVGFDLYIVDPGNPPLLLKLQDDGDINATVFPIEGGPYLPDNAEGGLKQIRTEFTSAQGYTLDEVTLRANHNAFTANDVGRRMKLSQFPDVNIQTESHSAAGSFSTNPLISFGEGALLFETRGFWVGTVRVEQSVNNTAWTTIYTFTQSSDTAGSVTNTSKVLDALEPGTRFRMSGSVSAGIDFTVSCDFTLQHQGGNYDVWGVITGYTSATEVTMDMEQYAVQDSVYTPNWAYGSFYKGNFPRTLSIFEERMYFGGTNDEPQTIWGSRVGDWPNFAPGTFEDDAITVTIASNRRSDIQWLTSKDSMHVGTVSDEWILGSRQSDKVISGQNLKAQKQGDAGSTGVQAITGSGMSIFVDSSKERVFSMAYKFESDQFESKELSFRSRSILGAGIKNIAWQSVPDNLLWCVLKDGTIATYTHEASQQVSGWSTQSTSVGAILDLAILRIEGRQYPIALGTDGTDVFVLSALDRVTFKDDTKALLPEASYTYEFSDGDTLETRLDSAYMDFAVPIYGSGMPVIGKVYSYDVNAGLSDKLQIVVYTADNNPLVVSDTFDVGVVLPLMETTPDMPQEIYDYLNRPDVPLGITVSALGTIGGHAVAYLTVDDTFVAYSGNSYVADGINYVTTLVAGSIAVSDDERFLSTEGAMQSDPVTVPEKAALAAAYGHKIKAVLETSDIADPEIGIQPNMRVTDPRVAVRESAGGVLSLRNGNREISSVRLIEPEDDVILKSGVIVRSLNSGRSSAGVHDPESYGVSIRIEHEEAVPLQVLAITAKVTV